MELSGATGAARFIRVNARWLAGGFLLTAFSSFGQTFFIGLSGADIRRVFDLSAGEFGGLYMIATLGSAATLPFLGRTLDIMPGWKVARFCLPALALACLALPLAPGIVWLGAALYLLRLFGQGMMTEIAYTEIGRWFAASRGRAMALTAMGLQAGNALMPLGFVALASAGGWHWPWFGAAALTLALGWPVIVKLIGVERQPSAAEAQGATGLVARDWTRGQVLRDPVLYMLLAGTLAPPFIGTIVFFHLGYLIELRGYDPLAFAFAFPVMAGTTVLFSLACGVLVDRFTALRLLPFYLLPLAVASLAVGLIEPVWGIYLFMMLLGVSNGFTQTIVGALWPEVYGLANLGGIRAIVVAAMVLSTAVGPGLTGLLIDRGVPLPEQMLGMAAWCLAASASLALASRAVMRREGYRAAT
ncbi:MFS transporter [Aurantiacibacter spongiae]|uniref:MFS transporter n=1 Tax=Aurantiacibacter spongiae TaxID=2488860 RepID=UPI0015F2C5F0|nr:MFS transporter [Aurantiacibacter spongiae]